MKRWLLFLGCFWAVLAWAQVDTASLNRMDSKGRKQGVWKKYEKGKLVYEGQFKDGVPFGTFRYFYPDGHLKSESEFIQGVHKVRSTIFHANGKKASEGMFVDQIKDGVWNYYAKNGTLITEEEYAMGRRTGVWRTFSSANGMLLEESHYLNDQLNGAHVTYYTDGNPSLEEQYLEGVLNGRTTAYLPGNKVSSTGNYRKGKRVGEWNYYDANTKIRATEAYNEGRLTKTYIYLYINGQPQKLNQEVVAYFIKKGTKTTVVLRSGNKLAQDEDLDDIALWVDFMNFTRVSPRVLAANSAIKGYKAVPENEDAIEVRLRPAADEVIYAEGVEAKMVKALFNTEKPKE